MWRRTQLAIAKARPTLATPNNRPHLPHLTNRPNRPHTIRTLRHASSSNTQQSLVISANDGPKAQLQLANAPVNALTLQLCRSLTTKIAELERDPLVRGLLIGSAVPNIFSAGLDLQTFYQPDHDTLAEYWTAVQEMWLALYTTPLATVAAISGHAPAGGCMLALSCDARVMVQGPYRMGLNETKLGIVAPPWFSRLLASRVGERLSERMLMRGDLVLPDEAVAIGLVDEVVPHLADLSGAASAQLDALLAVDEKARAATKAQARSKYAEALRSVQSEDLDEFITLITRDDVQAALGGYLESLRSKRKSGGGGAES